MEFKFRAYNKITNNIDTFIEIYQYSDGSLSYASGEEDHNPICSKENIVLSQFTGMKDIQKNEIYEGDILESTGGKLDYNKGDAKLLKIGTICKVKFHEGCFKLFKIGSTKRIPLQSNNIRLNGLKIIGNIYKNKNLLRLNNL